MIWLIGKEGNGLSNATYSLIRKLTRSKRWSRSISQYNLKSSSFESGPYRCFKLLGIDEMMRQMHVNRKYLNEELQGLIFEHLREKAWKIKEDLNVFDKNLRSKIIGQRGDGVLEREGLLKEYKWCTTEVEFSRSILVWHLATDICYRADEDGSSVSKEDEASRCLSEYMMYLLMIRPNMLSKGFGGDNEDLEYPGDHEKKYERTLRVLRGLKDRGPDDEGYQRTLRDWCNSESRGYDDLTFQRLWKTEKSVLRGVDVLARQLLSLGPAEKRWWIIREVWVEMIVYAAAHCPWKEHTHQLRRGGELLTHVSLLMLHLGLSEQYEYNIQADLFYLTTEEEEEYFQAREKYLEGTTIMSGSSTDEELKKLEKTVADTKRELERKERELEKLRSSLIASTPQQGIDSLPRSLPAQTDDQGTGQPPSNNEISLSME
ncbi:hypothetical protein NC651_034257 [Populus alba x Populus x berolinensis]|nr:hypothetical protein NC651_034257 [Populus alba x Populus x berolinensis]